MAQTLLSLSQSLRPRQWLKNLPVYTGIVFTGELFNSANFSLATQAFLILNLVSSSSYLLNDIIDRPSDRLHPFKKIRPIASGKLPLSLALLAATTLITFALFWSALLSPLFFLVITSFLLLQTLYTLLLRHLVILDILTIATAFVLRILAGEVLTGFFINVWLRLATVSLALFLAVGKRRAELTLIQSLRTKPSTTRLTLGHYTEKLLDVYTAMFANATWLTYAFYTFLERPPTLRRTLGDLYLEFFPNLTERKWLMGTIPFVLYGIMRYMQIIYEKAKGESPEQVITSDFPLLLNITLWAITVLFIIYGVGRS